MIGNIKNKLINTVYDGATSYEEIEKLKSTSDVILLSSDGITTLSNARFVKQIPVFIILAISLKSTVMWKYNLMV